MLKATKDISFSTKRLTLKLLTPRYALKVAEYVSRNKEFHATSMPHREDWFYSVEYQRSALESELESAERLELIRFFMFETKTMELVGDVVVGDIKSGKVSNCVIGVKIDKERTRNGFAEEALNAIIDFCFSQLKLHRIEANIRPENRASIRLFEKLGFKQEGLVREYFFTTGSWQDHLRYSILDYEFGEFFG